MYRVEYILEVLSENAEVTDNKIIADLEAGNVWAWCRVEVTARIVGITGVEGTEYLGCCSYKDEEEFRKGGFCKGMRRCALTKLRVKLSEMHEATHNLCNFDQED